MKSSSVAAIIASALTLSVLIIRQKAQAQNTGPRFTGKTGTMIDDAGVAKANDQKISPNFVTRIPRGYRDWRLVSVAHEEGSLNDIRAILGNDTAIKAYREGTLPFPEGSIRARIAWTCIPSEENNSAFGRAQSFIAGPPTNGVQFMVKDSKKYASTGGWGFAHFNEIDGKPADAVFMRPCFACHQAIKARDLVFTRYSSSFGEANSQKQKFKNKSKYGYRTSTGGHE